MSAARIGIVGPCCSGKSTLARVLREHGYNAGDIAQEHSFAPRMWRQIGRAEVLIFLNVSHPEAQHRRWMDWQPADLDEQLRRLAQAREACDLYVDTDGLAPEAVQVKVLAFLRENLAEPE